jgi:cation transport protein ChaC
MSPRLHLTEDHVARATRVVERVPYPTRFTPLSEEESRALARRILAGRPDGPLLIFANGSLIWTPTFEPVRRHRAVAHGWHRQFCMEIRAFGEPSTLRA